MGIIFHKKKKYGGTGVKVQSDASATSLNALDVPNGQTIESVLNSNFLTKTLFSQIVKLSDTGYIRLRDLTSGGWIYLDIFQSSGNGITIGVSTSGISAWKVVNGTQTVLFQNH